MLGCRRWARFIANGVIPTIRIGHEQQRYAVTRSGLEQSSRFQFRRTIRKAAHRQLTGNMAIRAKESKRRDRPPTRARRRRPRIVVSELTGRVDCHTGLAVPAPPEPAEEAPRLPSHQ